MRLRRALSVACVLPLPTMAVAQETGTLMPHRAANVNVANKAGARLTLRQFASCIAGRSPSLARKLTTLPVGSADYVAASKLVTYQEDCLSDGEVQMSSSVLRGALFETAYAKEFVRGGPTDFTAVAPLDYRAGSTTPLPAKAVSAVSLAQFGDCVSRGDGRGARALLSTLPGSMDESDAIKALGPKIGGCVPSGQKISFTKITLRGAIAEGLYRLSVAAKGGRS